MRRNAGRLALVVAAILTVGACSGDDGDDTDTDQTSEPTATTSASTAELRSALLTLRDMPAGWTAAAYDPESEDNLCPAEVAGPLGLDEEPESVGAQYLADPARGPSFSEAIQLVPADRGAELMPIVADAMTACDGRTYSGRTAHVTELDFPRIGEESAAYTIELGDVAIHVVYVVSGDVTIVMSAYDLTGGDPVGLLERYAPQAIDKAVGVLS
jgi:hypothetical protein